LLLNLGIGSALIYYTNREIDERPWITSSAYLLQLVIVIAGFIGLLLVQPLLTRVLFQNKVPVSLIYIGIWITPILTVLGLSYNLLTGLAEFGKYNVVRVVQAFLLLISSLVLVGAFSLKVFGSLLGVLFTNLIALVIIIWWLQPKIKLALPRFQLWRGALLAYGAKAWIGNILQYFNYRLDVFLVNYFLNPGAVAIYSIAVVISEALWYLPTAVSTVLFPKTAMDWEKAKQFTPLVVRTSFTLSIIIGVIMALLGKPAIQFVYGEQFSSAISPLIALLPGTILLGVGKIIASDIAGRGRPIFATWGAAATLILTILFDIWLIPIMGATGAALASTIAYGVHTIILVAFYIYLSGNHWASLFFIQKADIAVYLHWFHTYRTTLRNGLLSRKPD